MVGARRGMNPDGSPHTNHGKLIGIIAGAAVLVIAIILVVCLVVVPRLSSDRTIIVNPAPDLATTPKLSDGVSMLAGVEDDQLPYYTHTVEESGTAGVGLSYAQADYTTYDANHDSTGWYQGYTEEYARGLTDGSACFNSPSPQPANIGNTQYFFWANNRFVYCMEIAEPRIGDRTAYDDDAKPAYRTGFDDGLADTPNAHEIPAPSNLTAGSFIQGFSLSDAHSLWKCTLDDQGLTQPWLEKLGYQGPMADGDQEPNQYVAFNGGGKIAFLVSGTQGNPGDETATIAQVLVVLNATTGAKVSNATLTRASSTILAFVGETVILTDADGTYTKPAGGGAVGGWEVSSATPADYAGHSSPVIDGKWVFVGNGYVSIADGTPSTLGADASDTVSYIGLGGSLFRHDATASALMRLNSETFDDLWADPIPAASVFIAVTSSTVYTTTANAVGAYSLKTGVESWTVPISEPGDISALVADALITHTSALTTLIGAASHMAEAKYPNVSTVFAGQHMMYLTSEDGLGITAYTVQRDAPTKAWSLTMNPGQHIAVLTGVFVIWSNSGVIRTLT